MLSHAACIRRSGFSLIELMEAAAVMTVILLAVFSITQSTGNAWKSSRSRIESFQSARGAFENITHTLSQATLNTYYGYFDSSGRGAQETGYAGPDHYGRQSELHFVSGKALVPGQVTHAIFFQTPSGYTSDSQYRKMNMLLNACGYYVVYGKDTLRPGFLSELPHSPPNENRFRLMQFMQPSQELSVYAASSGATWFETPLASSSSPVRQLAENVVGLVILPRESEYEVENGNPLAAQYEYDSRARSGGTTQGKTENQLPPLVEIILVAVDDVSAQRIAERSLQLPVLFTQGRQYLERDLATLEDYLNENILTYRIFRTIVVLRNSKWTS